MEYVDLAEDESQYEGESFEYGQITEAKYVHAINPADAGNKYIEALPMPPGKAKIVQLSTKMLPGYIDDVSHKSNLQKLVEISKLTSLRLPLPSDVQLWTTIYTCLVESYGRRKLVKSTVQKKKAMIGGHNVVIDGELVGDEGAAVAGFNMIGESGSGKTSALRMALDYYPKVIRHTNDDGTKTIQIPYIMVTCPPNSNFRVLYADIGHQLDMYLGNQSHECEKAIRGTRRSTLGEMLRRVEDMIDLYAIGMIVFDEVQLMNFSNQAENSFNSLLAMANRTNVVIGIVGTSEAISNITRVEQIARRVGHPVMIDQYTTDASYFHLLFKGISKYQWFDTKINFTDDMEHEIFMESHGVIAYLVLIYMMISKDYLLKPQRPAITLNYIRDVIHNNFSTIHEALQRNYVSNQERELSLSNAICQAHQEINSDIKAEDEAESRAVAEAALSDSSMDENIHKETVCTQVKTIFGDDYNKERISQAYDVVRSRHPDYDTQKMLKAVIKRLAKGNTDVRRTTGIRSHGASTSTVQVNTDTMRSFIEDSIIDPNNPLGE